MASSPSHLTFLFLLFTISSFQVHARDNQLFSKFHHTSIRDAQETEVVPQKDMTSGTRGDDQPSSLVTETHNGYGLYGRGTDQFPTTTTTTNEASLSSFSLTKKMPSDEFYADQSFESNNNNVDNKNYGEEPKQYGLSDTRYQDNTNYFYYHNNVNKNGEEANQYSLSDRRYEDNSNVNNNNNNGYQVVKQQGMSDTRFVENGKYYYDVNNENNFDPNEYHFRGMNMHLRNHYNTNGAYNGNNEMDSYQEDVQNQETQQEFVP